MSTPKFKTGMRVLYGQKGQGKMDIAWCGKDGRIIGTIMYSEYDKAYKEYVYAIHIEYICDRNIHRILHECDGHVPQGDGWWVLESDLTAIDFSKEVKARNTLYAIFQHKRKELA